jgi:DNA-binding CsgD family transcriptional regulator
MRGGGHRAAEPAPDSQLLAVSQRTGSIEALSVREQEVLALIAEGRSNLQPSADDNRRVLAVLSYLKGA